LQDGKLYGVGDRGGIYTISTRNASAVKVSQLTVALNGRFFGVDFNPAANRLRVISDTGQNLRHHIDDPAGAPPAGTTATDGTLTYPPATAARDRRQRRGLHQQRPRPQHRDHAVRPRHQPRPDSGPVTGERREPGPDRQAAGG
jgi:hypothetical protein